MKVASPTRPPIILPTEILDMILDCLGGHKPTLAKCMRVSLRIYHIVAPRLYTHLDWTGRQPFPLFIPPISSPLSHRMSPSKPDLLRLVRSFDLGNHRHWDCSPSFYVDPLRNCLDTLLEVDLLKYSTYGKAVTQARPNHIDAPGSRCPILAKIAPEKLVIHASYTEPLPIRYIDRGSLITIVSFLDLVPIRSAHDRVKQKRQPFCNKSPNGKDVVYVIANMDADGAQPQSSTRSDPMACFRDHLMEVLYKPHFALDVYIVNGAGRAMESAGKIGYSCEKRFAALQADIRVHEELEADKVRECWKARKRGGTPFYKSVFDVGRTDIHFLDSREYLEDWITDGEFTDEERIWYMGKRST